MPGFDMSSLSKLFTMAGPELSGLAGKAAMTSSAPQLPSRNPGIIAPGAFAGMMNPEVGAAMGGMQNPTQAFGNVGGGGVSGMAGMAQGILGGGGLDASQSNAIQNATGKPPTQFPGSAGTGQMGQIQMAPIGIPQQAPQINPNITLAQLLGR